MKDKECIKEEDLKGNQEGAHIKDIDFSKLSEKEAFEILKVNKESGLADSEVRRRLEIHGENCLESNEESRIIKFLRFLWNPLSWSMEIAAILSIILLDYVDFILIFGLLFLNAIIGYHEETSAGNAIAVLTSTLSPKAKVLRNGEVLTREAANLVPGDIIFVRLGDVIPADCKILEQSNSEPLVIDQAALTGESLPVKKSSGQVVFSGSSVKQGESFALVYATGANTFFGKAASLVSGVDNPGHLRQVMTAIGAVCLLAILLWAIIELIVQFGSRKLYCRLGPEGSCPTISNLLVIIVGGIPIAMPTVLSVTLAMGAFRLASSGAIVSRLTAIEEMAGMDMLCSDKTGTLTLNQLSVDMDNLEPLEPFKKNDICLYAALSAKVEHGEPIDIAVHEACEEKIELWEKYECIKYTPFNPVDKKTVATIRAKNNGKIFRCSKGAPQVILKMARNYAEIKEKIDKRIVEYASRGYRALGVGYSEGENNDHWEYVGLIPLFDPPRHDTKVTIERCIELGIGVKMITGDQLPIAIETAKQLGMGSNMHDTSVLEQGGRRGLVQGTLPLRELIEQADGFAEVFPEHKYEIVSQLQKMKHIVGMTGDGVNDAPALKKSDIGIAVAGATEAARAAADIVLTQPGLGVIVEAIIGARKIFQRMKSYAKYTVAMTFRICFTFGLLTVIYNWNFPTILIVLLAIFNDGAMIALSKDRVSSSPYPESWLLREIFVAGLIYGLYLTISSWVLFYLASHTAFGQLFGLSYNLAYTEAMDFCSKIPNIDSAAISTCYNDIVWERQSRLRALMYAQVSISGLSLIFVTRTRNFSYICRPGIYLIVAFVISQLIATIVAIFGFGGYPKPLNGKNCMYCEHHEATGPTSDVRSFLQPSVLGCGGWVLVAWIWSLIWYLLLDPLKMFMNYIFENGFVTLFTGLGIRTTFIGGNASTAMAASRASTSARNSRTGYPRPSRAVRNSIY